MIYRILLKLTLALVVMTLALTFIIWFVWIPSARVSDYQFVMAWGQKGSAPEQFNNPTGIAVSKTEVYVSDARNARIQVFDFGRHFKRQFGTKGAGPGQLGRPMNLSIHNDELYVADYWSDRIQVFSLQGVFRAVSVNMAPGQVNLMRRVVWRLHLMAVYSLQIFTINAFSI